ncbi:MAG: methionine--tRNA ligase [Chloroflexota bacterium]
MPERILIGVAWPYASGPLHLGHVAGAYLPPDIFARYHRMKGNEVLMVSGTDEHGTPITIKAEQERVPPAELTRKYYDIISANFRKLGISFDLFTRTSTENHTQVAQEIFLTLLDKGYIYKAKVLQAYCPGCQRFLADRYVEGVCPYCAASGARGDQCDFCGKLLDTIELKQPKCRICLTTPEFRESEQFFLKLSAFQEKLLDWLKDKEYWRPNVLNFTRHYLEQGLKDRAITRDIEWGIPIPIEGDAGKCLYVWFEAVIGYLSAAKEWAKSADEPEAWRRFWQGDSRIYNFIGKDNIIFHTIIWPAMLMGVGDLGLPYDVPANEFLTLEGKKFSTSRNWAVWLPDYLARYDPEPLRYLFSINMPETGDADFSWSDYVRRNNDELVATYGNLVHRVLTFTYRNFDGAIPQPGEPDWRSQSLIELARKTLDKVGESIAGCHFKEGVGEAMALAQETNRYLDEKSPWKVIREDKTRAGASLYTAISVLSALKIAMYPYLPFSSERLNRYLGYDKDIQSYGWAFELPKAGQKLRPPEPLFTKLDEKVVEEETKRLQGGQAWQG